MELCTVVVAPNHLLLAALLWLAIARFKMLS